MISIVIPNFNGYKHLEVCLASLRNQTYKDFIITVVDNGSEDNSVELLKKHFSEVRIISHKVNTGFAGAVNDGIISSLDDKDVSHIVLLNNDIECEQGFLAELLNGFIDESVGSVACKMLNFYKRNIIDDTGDFLRNGGLSIPRGFGEEDKGQYDTPEFIFSACAGAAMYKREVFERAGLFDEDFFAYLEDIDFGFRLQLFGYKCFYNPKSVCYHIRGATTLNKSYLPTFYSERNIVFLRFKNYPPGLLLKYFFHFTFGRMRRLYIFARYYSFSLSIYAIKGYLSGVLKLYKMVPKRRLIHKNKKVSKEYIKSILLDVKFSDLKIKEKTLK